MNNDGLDVTSPRGGSFHRADGRGASGGACPRVNRAPSVASATTEFSSRRCNCCFVSLVPPPCFVVKVDPSSRGPPPTRESVTDETEERERRRTGSLLFRFVHSRDDEEEGEEEG
ncbi:hypothetical protein K0M31_011986, partial [Melipona bicolor]